jgi:hypothetical protein
LKIVAIIDERVVDQVISEIDDKILAEAALWTAAEDLNASSRPGAYGR